VRIPCSDAYSSLRFDYASNISTIETILDKINAELTCLNKEELLIREEDQVKEFKPFPQSLIAPSPNTQTKKEDLLRKKIYYEEIKKKMRKFKIYNDKMMDKEYIEAKRIIKSVKAMLKDNDEFSKDKEDKKSKTKQKDQLMFYREEDSKY